MVTEKALFPLCMNWVHGANSVSVISEYDWKGKNQAAEKSMQQHVELHGTHHGAKVIPKLVLQNYKSISSHQGTYALQQIPGTCTRSISMCVHML